MNDFGAYTAPDTDYNRNLRRIHMAAKAKKPAPRKTRDRAKQGHLPGLEPPCIKEIDDAAEAYVDARNDRMALLEREIELNDELLKLMNENKLKSYEFDGKIITVAELQKVKVNKKPAEKESEA